MSQRSAFVATIVEKLGAPLMGAVGGVHATQDGADDDPKKAAETIATLLARSVQLGVNLASSMDLKDSDAQGDSVRLALTAVAAKLVAGHYAQTGKIPGDNEIKKLVTGLESALTFADNFAPAADNVMRLENIETGEPALSDENQVNIQYINIFVPVVNAVAAFPFGRPEQKLVQEICDKLVARSKALSDKLVKGGDAKVSKKAELRFLAALAHVYAACHNDEKDKLMAMDEKARNDAIEASGGTMPVDGIWTQFDLRAGMLEVLGSESVPASGGASGSSGGPAADVPEQQQPSPLAGIGTVKPIETAPPPDAAAIPPETTPPAPPEPPAATPAEPPAEQPSSDNPMAFFKPGAKKDNESGEQ